MKHKNTPLVPGNNISKRIILILKKRFDTDKLYRLCMDLGFNQGGFRSSLESVDAFKQAARLDKISKYFDVSLQWLLYGDKSGVKIKNLVSISNLEQEIINLRKENSELREFIKIHIK